MKTARRTLVIVAAALLALPCGCRSKPAAVERVKEPGPLEGYITSAFVFRADETGPPMIAPDGQSIAMRAKSDQKDFVVKDGIRVGELYDQAYDPVFGPDSTSLAFQSRRGEKRAMVTHSVRRATEHDEVRSPVFRQNDGLVAYGVGDGGKRRITVDGVPIGGEYQDLTWTPVFSPDGRSIAAVAQLAGKSHAVWLKTTGEAVWKSRPYEDVGGLVFTPDGSALLYRAAESHGEPKKLTWFLGRTGGAGEEERLSEPFDLVGVPVVSATGSVAFEATRAGRTFIVRDKTPEDAYDQSDWPLFSPDGRHFAFVAKSQGKWSVVLDGKPVGAGAGGSESGGYEDIDRFSMAFSPDGSSLAFAARLATKKSVVVLVTPKESRCQGGQYDAVGSLAFSGDGASLAFTAESGGKWLAVCNGKQIPHTFDEVSVIRSMRETQQFVFAGIIRAKPNCRVYRVAVPW